MKSDPEFAKLIFKFLDHIKMSKDNTENNLKKFYENITTEMKSCVESDRFEKLSQIIKSRYLSNFGYFLSAF
jgi:hypothetical protein